MTLYLEYQKNLKELNKEMKVMNHPDVIKTMTDKYATYKKLKKYIPKTIVVKNIAHMKRIIKKNKGRLIVFKPRYGLKGIGVYAGHINKAPNIAVKNDYLFQEFIDSRNSGILKGVHDIRLYVINGKVVYHYSRVPKRGFLTNVARGGHVVNYPRSKIPKQVFALKEIVDSKFKKYKPRIYAIDFMIGKKPYILELNGFPGIERVPGEPKTIRYPMYNEFLDAISKSLK